MAKDRFDLEQDIMNCWGVCDDLQMLLNSEGYDNDDIEALARVYQRKFEALWSTFEDCIQNKFGYFPEQPNELGGNMIDRSEEARKAFNDAMTDIDIAEQNLNNGMQV